MLNILDYGTRHAFPLSSKQVDERKTVGVGLTRALIKAVLLLKDKTAETLQADLAGRLYKQFDPHDAEGTIPQQLTKWLEDYGIVVPEHP